MVSWMDKNTNRVIVSMIISVMALISPINKSILLTDINGAIAEILKSENIIYFMAVSLALYHILIHVNKIETSLLVRVINVVFAIILATFMNYGILFRSDLIFFSKVNLLLILVKETGLSLAFYIGLNFVESKLIKYFSVNTLSKNNRTNNYHLWLKWFLIIFICWIPYLFVLYPGISNSDTGNQLVEFFNHGNWIRDDYPIGWYLYNKHIFTITNQHNFLVTVLYGSNVKIGYLLFHNAAFGLFMNSLLQVALMIALYAYAMVVFNDYGMNKNVLKKIGLFFALFPLLPVTTMFITKNVLYTEAVLWSILLLTKAQKNKALLKKESWNILFILSIIGQLVTEKYAIYVLIIFTLFNFIFLYKNGDYLIMSFKVISVILIFVAGQSAVFKSFNISNGDPIEGESLMIQSTALYQKKYPNEQTVYQKKAINKVFVIKNLASLYNPVDSDPVKSSGNKKTGLQPDGRYSNHLLNEFKEGYRYRTVKKSDIQTYKKVWIKLMMKHPLVLLEAFMNGGYQYLDILSLPSNSAATVASDSFNVAHPGIYIPIYHRKEWIRIDYSNRFLKLRQAMSAMYNIFSKLPPFMLMINGNLLIILTIMLAITVLSLKLYKEFSMLLLLLVQIPVCMLSPVNGNQRYTYPFILSFMIILGIVQCFISSKNRR